VLKEPAEERISQEVSRIDALRQALWPRCLAGELDAIGRYQSLTNTLMKYTGTVALQPSVEISAADGRVVVSFATAPPNPTAPIAVLDLPGEDDETDQA
jgi:hypothetical protein